jgi:hypothetical protein
MMDDKLKDNARPHLFALRKDLEARAKIDSARLALERRRLVAAIEEAPTARVLGGNASSKTVWIISSAAAAILLVIFGAWMYGNLDEQDNPSPLMLSGLQHLAKGDALLSGRIARVPSAGGAKIVWPNRTAIWLAENATMRISADVDTRVELIEGRLLAAVMPVANGKSFKVQTPYGTVEVHGTAFSVSCDQERVIVRLHEGAVTFRMKMKDISLQPGFKLTMRRGRSPTIAPIDDIDVMADLMIAEKTADLDGPKVPQLNRRDKMPQSARVADPVQSLNAADGSQPRAAGKKPKPSKPLSPDVKAAEPSRQDSGLFIDPSLNEVEVLSGNEAAKQDTDPSAMIESLMRQGDYVACIAACNDYLSRFQGGAYAERVQYLKGCCQTKSGDLKAGREAFERYLISFPEGRQLNRVNQILGE